MSAPFRVALSGDFRKADGSAVYPDFDLKPLLEASGVETAFLDNANPQKRKAQYHRPLWRRL